jgi:hypothetical protein
MLTRGQEYQVLYSTNSLGSRSQMLGPINAIESKELDIRRTGIGWWSALAFKALGRQSREKAENA